MITVHEDILFCAFRYALGRRTYITAVVAECLIEKVDELSPRVRSIIIKEIDTAVADNKAGDANIDAIIWQNVATVFRLHGK